MKALTAVTTAYVPGLWFEKALLTLRHIRVEIEEVVVVSPEMVDIRIPKSRVVTGKRELNQQPALARDHQRGQAPGASFS
ncbi:MAG: hypothetical protein MZU91_06345 [Desulfosudis oleivorans]|nr:hypothetical protein [Desulfosudis oleivorans]